MKRSNEMLFSRWMLLVLTPIGVAIGLYEAWQLAGGMVVLMAAQILILTLIIFGLVRTVRRENAQAQAARQPAAAPPERETTS